MFALQILWFVKTAETRIYCCYYYKRMLSSHKVVEANTSQCVSYVLVKFQIKTKKAKHYANIYMSTALQDQANHFLHWLVWQTVSVRLAIASGSPLLLSSTHISAVCVSYIFYTWKMNNNFTCQVWWPRTPVLLCISFNFYGL